MSSPSIDFIGNTPAHLSDQSDTGSPRWFPIMTNKSLPGYRAIAGGTARFVEKHAQTLNLDPAALAGLQQGLAGVQRLEPAERLLDISEEQKFWRAGACAGTHPLSALARSANLFDSTPPSTTSASRPPASAGSMQGATRRVREYLS